MSIVGFNYTSISAQKTKDIDKKVGIRNNIVVKNVAEHKLPFSNPEDKALKISFEFKSEYSPNFGSIDILSDIFVVKSKTEFARILNEWKKDKRLPADLVPQYFSFILRKCNLKAMNLAEDLNLPSPYPMPKVAPPAENK